ncbi:hypothetical protein P9266_06020 [Bacillus subtilis]|uniref:hypothetical protein n=1 Tax=Bacillus TaxID=1386 RepID=UPI0003617BCD|nr:MULTISPECIES: hypothetical protein [Bacillus]KFH32871.1 hypothetical protein IA18_08085 [Bacillus subtilis subsp. subtilis]KFH33767.1 hypothetical protein IA17_06550 [Bacillus subtilis subsp. subtilis]MBR0000218.1 hypothetical protein [Bacillus subtilis]MBR0003542.1 hypothetical protein [Bacillus subtilis]MBR0011936.1 hypothetical protein [Bacillus subtilis]
MKLKKVLTGSALSLVLLVSASPAFAESPKVSSSNNHAITAQDIETMKVGGWKSRDVIPNILPFAPYKWYLKDAWLASDGTWTALYARPL